jgi:hypothetical protein
VQYCDQPRTEALAAEKESYKGNVSKKQPFCGVRRVVEKGKN